MSRGRDSAYLGAREAQNLIGGFNSIIGGGSTPWVSVVGAGGEPWQSIVGASPWSRWGAWERENRYRDAYGRLVNPWAHRGGGWGGWDRRRFWDRPYGQQYGQYGYGQYGQYGAPHATVRVTPYGTSRIGADDSTAPPPATDPSMDPSINPWASWLTPDAVAPHLDAIAPATPPPPPPPAAPAALPPVPAEAVPPVPVNADGSVPPPPPPPAPDDHPIHHHHHRRWHHAYWAQFAPAYPPYGGYAPAPYAIPPRNQLVEQPGPTQANRIILPLSSGSNVLPNTSVQVTSRSQTYAFRGERIVISGSESWIVNDVKIGNRSQLAQSGDLPGVLFSNLSVDCFISFETCQCAMDFVVVATNVGSSESGEQFVAAVLGTAAI